jgi:hypothetical protein
MEVPMYQLFYDGEEPPKLPDHPKRKSDDVAWGGSGKDAKTLSTFRRLLSRTSDKDLKLLLLMAHKMARPVRTNGKNP